MALGSRTEEDILTRRRTPKSGVLWSGVCSNLKSMEEIELKMEVRASELNIYEVDLSTAQNVENASRLVSKDSSLVLLAASSTMWRMLNIRSGEDAATSRLIDAGESLDSQGYRVELPA